MNFSNAILAELTNKATSISKRQLMLLYNNSALYEIKIEVHYYDCKEVAIEINILRDGLLENQFSEYMPLLEWVQMQEGAL